MAVSRPLKKEITIMAFKEWTLQKLEDTFHLIRQRTHPKLSDWLKMPYPLSDLETQQLIKLREELEYYGEYWNEEELKMNFIAPLLKRVHLRTDQYNIFYERKLQAVVEGYILTGKVDMMVASGRYEPKAPFFCFHEYKREIGKIDDPKAQLLCEMLTAQTINANGKPIYGAYIIGRNWFFVVLKDRAYCVSNAFVASKQEDLVRIYATLVNFKTIIERDLLVKS